MFASKINTMLSTIASFCGMHEPIVASNYKPQVVRSHSEKLQLMKAKQKRKAQKQARKRNRR